VKVVVARGVRREIQRPHIRLRGQPVSYQVVRGPQNERQFVLAIVVGAGLLWFDSELSKGTGEDSDFLWALRHPFAAYDIYFDRPNPELAQTLGSEQAAGIAWMLAHPQTTATLVVDPPPSLRAKMAEALSAMRGALSVTPPNGDDKSPQVTPQIESLPATQNSSDRPSPADVQRGGVACSALIAISTPKIGDDGLKHSTVTCLNAGSAVMTMT
jgi:hypothetical protein